LGSTYIFGISISSARQVHWVKVKVTGAKMGYTTVTEYTH